MNQHPYQMVHGPGRGYGQPNISGMLQNMNIHQTSTSGLNVQAPVFVPGGVNVHPGYGPRSQHHQPHYNQFQANTPNGFYPAPAMNISSGVPSHGPNGPYPSTGPSNGVPYPNLPAHHGNPEDPFTKMISEVEIGLERLVEEPHNFDAWAPAISDRLKLTKMDQQQLRDVAAVVFEFALWNPQASYSVAKLCALLNVEKIRCAGGANDATSFRDELLSRCRQEYEARGATLVNSSDRVRAFGLFLSELFIQMENTSGLRLFVLEAAIHDIINDLAQHNPQLGPPTEANVRCAVSMLKCSGRSLSEGLEEQRRRIPNHIQLLNAFLQSNPNCSEPLKRQIVAVTEQVANNWKQSIVPALNTPGGSCKPVDDGCIFGPDGEPLTEEEVAFLESQSAPYIREESLNASVDLSNEGVEDIERELVQFLEEHDS